MTRALEETAGLSGPDTKVLQDIQRVGWHVIGVFAKEGQKGQKGSDWAFSIGLFHSYGHPEVVIAGLPVERCMTVVNAIGQAIRSGKRFETGQRYDDILQDPYKCMFRDVDRHHYRDYVGYALWFYEQDPFPLMQCFWPDEGNRLPWEDRCDD
jgi:uncharacterized protein DUF4262